MTDNHDSSDAEVDLTRVKEQLAAYGAAMRPLLAATAPTPARRRPRGAPLVGAAAAVALFVLGGVCVQWLMATPDVAVSISASESAADVATATPEPTATITPAPTVAPAPTLIPTGPAAAPTATASSLPDLAATQITTETGPADPTATPTASTATATTTASTTPTATPTAPPAAPTSTPTAAPAATATPTATTSTPATAVPTMSPTATPTATPATSTAATATPTATPAVTTAATASPTATPAVTTTPTPTTTQSAATPSPTTTTTPSAATPSPTATVTPAATVTPSATPSPPATVTPTATPSPTATPDGFTYELTVALRAPDGSAVSTDSWLVSIDGQNFTEVNGATWIHESSDTTVPVWVRSDQGNGCLLRGFVQLYTDGPQSRTIDMNQTNGCVTFNFALADGTPVNTTSFLVSNLGHSTDLNNYQTNTDPNWLRHPVADSTDWYFRILRGGRCDLLGSILLPDPAAIAVTVTLAEEQPCSAPQVSVIFRDPAGAIHYPGFYDISEDGGTTWQTVDSEYWSNPYTSAITLTVRVAEPGANRCVWRAQETVPNADATEVTFNFDRTYSCIEFEPLKVGGGNLNSSTILISDVGPSANPADYVNSNNSAWRTRTFENGAIINFHARLPQPSGCDLVGDAPWGPSNVDLLSFTVAPDASCVDGEYELNFTFVGPQGEPVSTDSWILSTDNASWSFVNGPDWSTTEAGTQLSVFVRVPIGDRCLFVGNTVVDTPGASSQTIQLDAGYGCIEWQLVDADGVALDPNESFRLTDGAPTTNIHDLFDPYWTSWRIRPLTTATTFHLRTATDSRSCQLIGTATVPSPGGAVTVTMTPDPTC